MTHHPRVALNLVSGWKWTLERHLAFAGAEGIGAISVTAAHLGGDPQAAIAAIREAGLRVVSAGTGGGSLIDGAPQTLARLAPIIETASALGCEAAFTVTGPSPPHLPTDEACRRLVASLGTARDHAVAQGTRLAIEHSSPATRANGFICTLADAVAVACEADIAVAVELQNCWYEAGLERLFHAHAGRFAVVQVSDFKVGEDLRMNRRVPGDGDMPLEWLLARLLDAGYSGWFELEMLGPAIEAEGYESAIRRGMDWLGETLVRLGA